MKISNVREQSALKILLRSHGIMDAWHNKTWEDLDGDTKARKAAQKYVDQYKICKRDNVGFYVTGPSGVGKSLLVNLVFKDLLVKYRQDVQIVPFNALVSSFTSGWYDKGERVSLEKMMAVDFLAIEGLGEEFRSGELHLTTFETLLKARLQRHRPLWVVSRLSPSQIKKDYGENVASLIKESCVSLAVSGEDYRQKIYERNKKMFV